METNAKYENVTLPFSVCIHQRTPFNSGYPVYYQDPRLHPLTKEFEGCIRLSHGKVLRIVRS